MMLTEVAKVARIVADALEVTSIDPHGVVRRILALALELVPEEDVRRYLTEEARKRVEAETDRLEQEKFG